MNHKLYEITSFVKISSYFGNFNLFVRLGAMRQYFISKKKPVGDIKRSVTNKIYYRFFLVIKKSICYNHIPWVTSFMTCMKRINDTIKINAVW